LFVLSRILLLALAIALCVIARLYAPGTQPLIVLKVAAASDLSAAMEQLAPAFEKKTGIRASVSLGSSGNFFAQIQNGAPFDAFLSADRSYPEKLEKAGQAEPGSVIAYARGKLVLWLPNSSHLQLGSQDRQLETLSMLRERAVRKIAIANPEHAPYGRAAVAALQHFQVYDQVKDKLVLGENISQTAQFAQSGNADVAFLALSIAQSAPMEQAGRWLSLPDASYPAIEQAGAIISSSTHKPEARLFLDFLCSAEAQVILHKFGFEAPAK
jgi:molybdate transport system substrate-binding protein